MKPAGPRANTEEDRVDGAGRGTEKSARPDAPPGPWGLYLAVVLIVAAAACLLFLRPASPRDDGPDTAETSEVIGVVGDGLVRVFTYRDGDLATTETAAAELLDGRALEEYRQLFSRVRVEAPAQKLSVATRVVRAGVVSLSGDDGQLLVFLDQTTTRAGKPPQAPVAAQLLVNVHRTDGRWKITELRAS